MFVQDGLDMRTTGAQRLDHGAVVSVSGRLAGPLHLDVVLLFEADQRPGQQLVPAVRRLQDGLDLVVLPRGRMLFERLALFCQFFAELE